ncbi:vanadium-dependent haloperoxidase [Rhodopseudomonas palustris]|uniref:vanadium-dependent haloperoxidase n=1 Tax=Rhodopseudomonas palustris TaxID=1076 RepID=UPI0018DB1C22|nr:vanadium-dependent haloperoxidase [Rhodopseudomonas palustris]
MLQTQSLDDFRRILSPGLISREVTSEKVSQLNAEAAKSCFAPDAFQRAIPALPIRYKRPLPCAPQNAFDRFVMWNQIALDTTSMDHAPPPLGTPDNPALHNYGPHRSSRVMAIVHIAMFDAINLAMRFDSKSPDKPRYVFATYLQGIPNPKEDASVDMAITYSAGETLKALYPQQVDVIENLIAIDEGAVLSGKDRNAPMYRAGRELGITVAKAILRARRNDGSAHEEPQVGDPGFPLAEKSGQWRPDPVSNIAAALGGKWKDVQPFVIKNVPTFRPPPPPSTDSAEYARDFEEVRKLGGENTERSRSERSADQTLIGTFWAYDGTAFLCAPPRLYNQVIRQIVQQQIKDGDTKDEDPKLLNYARLFALANIAMADAAIAAWDAKYHYRYWRPVVGIRAAATDGNDATHADVYWKALGAPASNSVRGPNFTPPFPAYPSGHATFGGALFEVLRAFYPDDTSFSFISDEYNGQNKPAGSDVPRPEVTRRFVNFRAAEDENARSRVYLGVHWQFDADAGIAQGNQVGSFVVGSTLRCLDDDGRALDCKPGSGFDVKRKFLISTEKRVLSTPFTPSQ